MTEASNSNGMPYWEAARAIVHRSLAAPRTHHDPKLSGPGIDLEWWRLARDRYKSALFFCPCLTDRLTGRHTDINRRVAELSKNRKIEPAYIPNKQTLQTAIKAEEGVSLQFLIKTIKALACIVEHETADIADYEGALDALSGISIIPAFHVLNWDVLAAVQRDLGFDGKLDAFSNAVFAKESRILGKTKSAVLSQIKDGYAMGPAPAGGRRGTLTVTAAFADAMEKGIEALAGKRPDGLDALFQMNPHYNTKALLSTLGNITAV